jgi:hypothetical protein
MYRIIIPAVFSYAAEFDMEKDVIDWIKSNNDIKIVSLYALSIADEIIDSHLDFINDILNSTTARTIAISKLKRLSIVNNGLFLKLSMRDCGLF